MKRTLTNIFLTLIVCMHTSAFVLAQGTTISGSITDETTGESLIGVNILVKGTVLGTISDLNGEFNLSVRSAPPLTLVVTSVGYEQKEVEVTSATTSGLTINLRESVLLGQEIVVSASRVEESTLRSPVAIQRMDILDIQNNASTDFYDALKNMNGIDFSTQSLTFKSVNARGFGSNGNTRFVQMIDGIDNQAPGLNFPVGNVVGIGELDLESVEMIPGPASALYGPNALQGILLMQSKSPFDYQGLSAYVKLGVNHIDGEDDDPSLYQDYGFRYAKAFNNKFAFKLTASYLGANDFVGVDTRDQGIATGNVVERGATERGDNRFYDGVNEYGDFLIDLATVGAASSALDPLSALLPSGIQGSFTPKGYAEGSFVDNRTESIKFGAGLHYRLNDNVELLGQFNWGSGSTVYTANDRFVLDDFVIWTGKVELRGSNFFLRAYTTQENSGDSYAANTLASLVNQQFYLPSYAGGFVAARGAGLDIDAAHATGRLLADSQQPAAGSPQFNEAVDIFRSRSIADGGALFLDKSNMYHYEGSYNFSDQIEFMDLVVGANLRNYNLNSEGTLFALEDNGDEISYTEYGAYAQVKKSFINDALDIQASLRYDKNEFFTGQFSPRFSAVMEVAPDHNIRGSFQRGFRIPTTQDQFIDLNVVSRWLIGSTDFLKQRYNFVGSNPASQTYLASDLQAVAAGELSIENLETATALLEEEFDTEKVNTLEGGYRGLFLDGRLLIDGYYFYNIYQDFIAEVSPVQAYQADDLPGTSREELQTPIPGFDATTADGKLAILNGEVATQTYGVDVNADGNVRSQGWGLSGEYTLNGGYRLGANVSYNELISDQDLQDQGFLAQFNTPEYRYNVSFGNRKVTDNLGFNVAWRWQEAFLWQSSFGVGVIPAFGTLDAQVSYKLPELKTIVKLGGSNVLNKRFTTSYGNPRQGAIFYLQLTFDEFLN
ncbi:MAG: TonB-dependent receptor [Bacteroidota bacterium]